MSADGSNCDGAFDYAFCLHYGIGVDIDLAEAFKYYELSASHRNPVSGVHSFRCLRSLNKARLSVRHFCEFTVMGVETLEHCISVRSFTSPAMVADYCEEAVPYQESHQIGIGCSAFVTVETGPQHRRKYMLSNTFTLVGWIRDKSFEKSNFWRG
jgi:TPR repeat protein